MQDATGDAIQVCEKLVLKPYRIALKGVSYINTVYFYIVRTCAWHLIQDRCVMWHGICDH